ncbi:MCE family protein [Nocardioides zeae]|uniref:MCE family protein n=1 Tax=Nocardioides zeae TaxID=1457234 RepID=A0A6P0HH30_9ACTN|nr:MCE family protein [Nocardioides zeae]NEN77597.1 MCE family protein [Nocardioides zeae]
MKMFRERNPIPLGAGLAVWLVLTVLVVLNISTLTGLVGRAFSVQLSEAAGLRQGDPVRVGGLGVGRVTDVRLEGPAVLVEFSLTDGDVRLGSETRASVGVDTVLGDKSLELEPRGPGELEAGATIPLERTRAPYDVSQALADLTVETGQIDVEVVADALGTTADALDAASPELAAAVEGVARLSTTISSRDAELQSLLGHAESFSAVLSARTDDVTELIASGNLLFTELLERREDLGTLLGAVEATAAQLNGLVADNRDSLGPALDQLNGVTAILRANEEEISSTLRGLAVYATSLGEVVSSGPFFTAYLQNLVPGNLVPPVLDLSGLSVGEAP